MARQQIERLEFVDRSRMTDLRVDQETGYHSGAGVHFKFFDGCRHMAAAISRTVADAIRPRDDFFGSHASTASFTLADRRFAWVGIAAGIAGLGAIFEHRISVEVGSGELARAASGGRLSEAVAGMPRGAARQVTTAAETGFVGGLNQIFLVAALVAFAGALLGAPLLRPGDFGNRMAD
jgi:hypothetical protein